MTAPPVFCTECGSPIDDGRPQVKYRQYYELLRLPGGAITGELWRFCSLGCLEHFVQGNAR